MKKKVLILIILMTFVFTLFLGLRKVEAYSGEIDPQNYMTLPGMILVSNNVGTGKIILSSNITGYNVQYQKVDITREKYDEIISKQASSESEYIEELPDYTSSWKTATDNNIELDFTNYTGIVYFVLWAKINNGTNTYYDCKVYSSKITETPSTTENSSGDATITSDSGDWTDFSNAKFELKKNRNSKAIVEITGVTPKDNSSYYLFITSDSNKPDVNGNISDARISLTYDTKANMFKSIEAEKIARYVELNQDLYATVLERKNLKDNIDTYGNKLERFAEATYSDAFSNTFMSSDKDQIVTSFTHDKSNNRKMQIKVGKITNTSILQKIKEKNTAGFFELLSYAKSNSGIYDKTLDADKNDSYAIEYNAGSAVNTGNSVISLKGLKNEEYYYLYVKTMDENGKYISNEAVTLAQASVHNDGKWWLFFYGSSDFKWVEWQTTETKTTKTKTSNPAKLPYTGTEIAVFSGAILMLIASGVVAYIKYKKYDF